MYACFATRLCEVLPHQGPSGIHHILSFPLRYNLFQSLLGRFAAANENFLGDFCWLKGSPELRPKNIKTAA